ncbi:hypothetical protein [Nostoc favosum]|uniref:Uncharacterized protein n=1 Tax=Nostoc favosum CHAB5714 TaxID=2780399 RepID=A0ABS8I3L1_9NOSO|nr:hypothetical protein [Nostoc favosum]MCC5598758.1 hypothetical protein [Nostoc favosum CHAB5714]
MTKLPNVNCHFFIGHWALGIGHWALGIGHWALVILPHLPTELRITNYELRITS